MNDLSTQATTMWQTVTGYAPDTMSMRTRLYVMDLIEKHPPAYICDLMRRAVLSCCAYSNSPLELSNKVGAWMCSAVRDLIENGALEESQDLWDYVAPVEINDEGKSTQPKPASGSPKCNT